VGEAVMMAVVVMVAVVAAPHRSRLWILWL
jgi:hypothetical protein